MAEYIEREAALNFDESAILMPGALQPFMDGMAFYADHIKRLPAADVAPVRHGRWVSNGTDWVCSECGEEPWWCGVTEDVLPPYCPNCGAKMDGDGE